MKVKSIKSEKHAGDGPGVVRVIIEYEMNNGKSKTATMYGDVFTGQSEFGSNDEFMEHVHVADALDDIAGAAMTLMYYGWEA